MPISPALPLTIDADSRLSDDLLLVEAVSVDPAAATGTALASGGDGNPALLAVVAGLGAAEVRPSPRSASGYVAVALPDGAGATEIAVLTDGTGALHAFYRAGSAVLHSSRGDDGRWGPPDTLPAASGLAVAQVPFGGQVVSGVGPDGNLVLYTAGGSGQWTGASVDTGHALLDGQARIQYTGPDSWILFAPRAGALAMWSGAGTAIAAGPATVSVDHPVARVHFTYLHANSAMVVFSDSDHALYSSVGFTGAVQKITLGRAVRGAGVVGPDDGLIRFYACDPDGKLWALRQTAWASDDSPVWAPIFPLDVDAADVAVPAGVTGAIAVTRVDGIVDLLAQRGGAGMWDRVPVRGGGARVPLRVSRYRTRLTVRDANGVPCPGTRLTVTPSDLVSLETAGRSVVAAPGAPAGFAADATGAVEFSQPATSLDAVTFTASADGARAPVTVTPYGYLHAALGGTGSVFTGSATVPPMSAGTLRSATVGGAPLAPGLTPDLAKVAADGIAHAIAVSNGTAPAGFEIDLADPAAPRFAVFRTKAELDARLAEREAAGLGSIWDEIAQFGEDIWNAVKSAAMTVTNWVVDTGRMVVSATARLAEGIVAELKGLALGGVGAIVSLVHSVFGFIGATLATVLDWLKDFFHWDSIWRTTDAFYGYLTGGVSSLQRWIGQSAVVATGHFFQDAKSLVAREFATAEAKLGDLPLGPDGQAAGRTRAGGPGYGPPGAGPPATLPGSPAQLNWVWSKIASYLPQSPYLHASGLPDGLFGQIQAAIASSGIGPDGGQLVRQLQQFFAQWTGNPRGLLGLRAADALAALQPVVDVGLDATDVLLTLALDLTADAVGAFGNILTQPLTDNPVLNWLWEHVVRPPDSTDELTLGSLLCLALAAPVTLACIQERGAGPYDPTAPGLAAAGPLGDGGGLDAAQFYTSSALVGIDGANDLINVASSSEEAAPAGGDGPSGSLPLLWNWFDWVSNVVVQVLFWPVGDVLSDWDWSKLSYGGKLSAGTWVGYWAPLVTDAIFLSVESDYAVKNEESPAAALFLANAILDCVFGLTLTGLGTAGAVTQIKEGGQDVTWLDAVEAFVGPLPWAGQPLLLPSAVEATGGLSVPVQLVLDLIGDYDASGPG